MVPLTDTIEISAYSGDAPGMRFLQKEQEKSPNEMRMESAQ